MRSWHLMLLALGPAVVGMAWAEEGQGPTVTLSVTDQPATEVAQQLTQMTGVQIAIVGPAEAKVTFAVEDAKLDEAVKAFAQSFDASWLRSYFIEAQPPQEPYTADQILAALEYQRNAWMQSMSQEQREALMAQWRETSEAQRLLAGTVTIEYPGAGESPLRGGFGPPGGGQEGPGGQAPAGGQGGPGGPMFDPVRSLINPVRSDTVTLALDNVALPQALQQITTLTGFLVCASQDLAGNVTLTADNQPLDQVLDQIAAAVNAQCRRVYTLSVPRVLTEQEIAQRMEAGFQSRMAQFWASSPEERAQQVNQWVERINSMAERMRQPGPDGQPNRFAQAFQRFAPRILSRLAEYSAGLSQSQRAELKPIITALGNALNR